MCIDLLTICKYNNFMIMQLLGHKDYLRILLALERKPLRFTEIQNNLELNPAQVDRAVRFLSKGLWIIPATSRAPGKKIRVQYSLGRRGEAFLKTFESFRTEARRRKADIGESEVAELQSLSR